MRNVFFFCILFLMPNVLFSQSEFNFGASFVYAPSTLLNKTSVHDETGLDFNFKMKNSLGGFIDFDFYLNDKWHLTSSVGFMQRGARFSDTESDFLPRYRLSYLDFSLGTTYCFDTIKKKILPLISVSFTQHKMLRASIANHYDKTDIINEITKSDFGVLISAGVSLKIFNKNTVHLMFFINQGFKNIFSGIYRDNGLIAYNSVFGLKTGYFLR